jgi:transposase
VISGACASRPGPLLLGLRDWLRPPTPPMTEDSGDSQPQLRISKAGDMMLRQLLVGSAHYILGPFGPDTDLRRYGLQLCERGGKNAKKRAAVAVARKLAVLLHRLWVSGEVYEPLRHGAPTAEAA